MNETVPPRGSARQLAVPYLHDKDSGSALWHPYPAVLRNGTGTPAGGPERIRVRLRYAGDEVGEP